jgi:hypothetical protein
MFAEESDGEVFGADDCVGLVGGETWDDREAADVGQMLLKFVLGSAFHSNESSPTESFEYRLGWPLAITLQLVTFSRNRNSTIVVEVAGY